MEVAGDGAVHLLRDSGDEGNDVVVGLGLYLVDALDGEARFLGELLDLFGWNLTELCPRAADGELDLEPCAILGFFGPDGPDLREGVAFDHGPPFSLSASSGSESARIWAASTAAFVAPLTATVATGTPEGIWTVASRASKPPRVPAAIGIPMTGRFVLAATAPARWAAIPAAQIKTLMPRPGAEATYSATASGLRWADRTSSS